MRYFLPVPVQYSDCFSLLLTQLLRVMDVLLVVPTPPGVLPVEEGTAFVRPADVGFRAFELAVFPPIATMKRAVRPASTTT